MCPAPNPDPSPHWPWCLDNQSSGAETPLPTGTTWGTDGGGVTSSPAPAKLTDSRAAAISYADPGPAPHILIGLGAQSTPTEPEGAREALSP